MVFGEAYTEFREMNIYKFNIECRAIAVYRTLREAQKETGIPDSTIAQAIKRKALCRGEWYFSREMVMVPGERVKSPVAGKKFTVMVTDEVWDRLLVAVGQRKKQDIFRNLLSEWLENEEQRHDRQKNKKA
jgi:hypothetical protein